MKATENEGERIRHLSAGNAAASMNGGSEKAALQQVNSADRRQWAACDNEMAAAPLPGAHDVTAELQR
jgi:hypothetical protein